MCYSGYPDCFNFTFYRFFVLNNFVPQVNFANTTQFTCGSLLLLPGQVRGGEVRFSPWICSPSQPSTIRPRSGALCPALWPPVPRLSLHGCCCCCCWISLCVRCSDGPGLSGSAVIRWCLKRGDARRRVRGLRRRRPYHSAGIPSAPGAIRSQAEGGMPLSSKSQTGQRGGKKNKKTKHPHTHARVRRGVRAGASNFCKMRQDLGGKKKN